MTAVEGQPPGLVAFDGDRAVGHGARTLEGYPVVVDEGEPIHPGSAFTGTLPMFEPARFTVVAERASDPSSAHTRVVVRRELVAAASPTAP